MTLDQPLNTNDHDTQAAYMATTAVVMAAPNKAQRDALIKTVRLALSITERVVSLGNSAR